MFSRTKTTRDHQRRNFRTTGHITGSTWRSIYSIVVYEDLPRTAFGANERNYQHVNKITRSTSHIISSIATNISHFWASQRAAKTVDWPCPHQWREFWRDSFTPCYSCPHQHFEMPPLPHFYLIFFPPGYDRFKTPKNIKSGFNPSRPAVPFWEQTTQISSNLSPKRGCGSKRVN